MLIFCAWAAVPNKATAARAKISFFIMNGEDRRLLLFVGGNGNYRSDGISLTQVDDTHALRSTSRHTDLIYRRTDRQPRTVNNHQVVLVGHSLDRNQLAGFFRNVDRLHTLAAAVGNAVFVQIGTLAVTVLAEYQHVLRAIGFDADHADHLVAFVERNTAHTGPDTSSLKRIALPSRAAIITSALPLVSLASINWSPSRITMALTPF